MKQIDENDIILIVSLAALAFFGLRWVRGRMLRNRARDWPKAVGRVSGADLQIESRGNNQSVHVANINYSYDALGTAHHGVWKRSTILHGKAQGWIDKHPSGANVCVRYDPSNPGLSLILDRDQTEGKS